MNAVAGPGDLLVAALSGTLPTPDEALALAECDDIEALTSAAALLRDRGHGDIVTYSPKVFIPLTHLCRDVCHYCTFAEPPARRGQAFMTLDQVLDVARAGAAAGCHEALFTLGDKPELRYRAAREELAAMGHDSTLSYLAEAARAVRDETGLLPHLNPGLMSAAGHAALRPVSASMGMMLESLSPRLTERGGPHFGSPDKAPARRLAGLDAAGVAAVPYTTGILIGIGENRIERIEALLAIRDSHRRHGHVQEVIVQNFCPKPGTKMADAPEAAEEEMLWTVAVARLVLGAEMHIQAPPNLNGGRLGRLIAAGIDDWGGVSPVTPDHVNPERAWPHVDELAARTAAAGKTLVPRLPLYPEYLEDPGRWTDPAMRRHVLAHADASGHARTGTWRAGVSTEPPSRSPQPGGGHGLDRILARADAGARLEESEVVRLFGARGRAFEDVIAAADDLRRRVNGDTVTYVVNRNINYTNICLFHCRFCAFSKGRTSDALRGKPYDLDLDEIARRAAEAWMRGATEVCLQGGIHPSYTGRTYVDICRAVKAAAPGIHVHAFSPLEIWQGAQSAGLSVAALLAELQEAGLGSLPGTAAEILDDEVRAIICPDKLGTADWFAVMEAAHGLGLRTTSTIMFGHVEQPRHWARHLLRIRELQERTGGFTEFVPLPFVAAEAPLFVKGGARPGPTWEEAVLMHAVPRLAFHPVMTNIQTSWVKMGPAGALACLDAGANDLGGTLMNESITRAAGAAHGQELPPGTIESMLRDHGRPPRQRTTLYAVAEEERRQASFDAPDLLPAVNAGIAAADRVL